mgnify:FL=1
MDVAVLPKKRKKTKKVMKIIILKGKSNVRKILQFLKKLEKEGGITHRSKKRFGEEKEVLEKLVKQYPSNPIKVYKLLSRVDEKAFSHERFKTQFFIPALVTLFFKQFFQSANVLESIKEALQVIHDVEKRGLVSSLHKALVQAIAKYRESYEFQLIIDISKNIIENKDPTRKWEAAMKLVLFGENVTDKFRNTAFFATMKEIERKNISRNGKVELEDKTKLYFDRTGD